MIKKFLFCTFLFLPTLLFAGGNTGGMDPGGGGTLPAFPISIQEVANIALEAKPEVLYFFNDYEWRYKDQSPSPLYQKLFKGQTTVQEVLKKLRIEVLSDRACKNSINEDVDGSIHASKFNTICISAFRIAQKIDKAAAKRELLALIAHETTHFMGANESEAVSLQQDFVSQFMNLNFESTTDFFQVRRDLEDLESKLNFSLYSVEYSDFAIAQKYLTQSLNIITQIRANSSKSPFRVFNLVDSDYQDLLETQLKWASLYLETLIVGDSQSESFKKYESTFQGRDYFLLHELGVRTKHIYENSKVLKIHSPNELADLLNSIQHQYQVRSLYVGMANVGAKWINLKGHKTILDSNPWESFIGRYHVQAVSCDYPETSENYEIEFEVKSTQSGVVLSRIFKNSILSIPIRIPFYQDDLLLTDYGLKDKNTAYLISEFGGHWTNRFPDVNREFTLTLEQLENRKFKIIKSEKSMFQDMTKQDIHKTCTFEGHFY